MEINESKLDPELRRWVQKDTSDERTVVVRLTFSQDPKGAADTLGKIGMVVQTWGPSVVVASSDCRRVMEASRLSWVAKIDLPQQLNMKSRLPTI